MSRKDDPVPDSWESLELVTDEDVRRHLKIRANEKRNRHGHQIIECKPADTIERLEQLAKRRCMSELSLKQFIVKCIRFRMIHGNDWEKSREDQSLTWLYRVMNDVEFKQTPDDEKDLTLSRIVKAYPNETVTILSDLIDRPNYRPEAAISSLPVALQNPHGAMIIHKSFHSVIHKELWNEWYIGWQSQIIASCGAPGPDLQQVWQDAGESDLSVFVADAFWKRHVKNIPDAILMYDLGYVHTPLDTIRRLEEYRQSLNMTGKSLRVFVTRCIAFCLMHGTNFHRARCYKGNDFYDQMRDFRMETRAASNCSDLTLNRIVNAYPNETVVILSYLMDHNCFKIFAPVFGLHESLQCLMGSVIIQKTGHLETHKEMWHEWYCRWQRMLASTAREKEAKKGLNAKVIKKKKMSKKGKRKENDDEEEEQVLDHRTPLFDFWWEIDERSDLRNSIAWAFWDRHVEGMTDVSMKDTFKDAMGRDRPPPNPHHFQFITSRILRRNSTANGKESDLDEDEVPEDRAIFEEMRWRRRMTGEGDSSGQKKQCKVGEWSRRIRKYSF